MRVLILRSEAPPARLEAADPYQQVFTGAYAEKVVGNLRNEPGFCGACGRECDACRQAYDRRFGRHIAAVISLPAVLPYLLEDPARHVPRDVPAHEVLLALHVHEQILLEMLKRCGEWGTRGVVVPIEAGDWLSGSAQADAERLCRDAGVEAAFPKPFCDFDPPAGTLLAEFRRRFCIGKPEVELTLDAGRIARAYVHVAAACGATYYVARGLVGKGLDEDLRHEVVSKRLHSYPCTASMAWDDQLGDTILHVAGQAHYEILTGLPGTSEAPQPKMVMSPVGHMLLKPVPARENIQKIERAKQAILAALDASEAVALRHLARRADISPAALSSAVLLLKQAGAIRTEGGRIVRA